MRLVALALALALAGCMKIYTDSELPDIKVTWGSENCSSATPDISIALSDLDTNAVTEQVLPCADESVILRDVARHRYRIDGLQLSASGAIVSTASNEVDLRNGFNEEAYLYFPNMGYFRVGWVFEAGSSCDSLSSNTVIVDFIDSSLGSYSLATSCYTGLFIGYPYGTKVSVQLRAVSSGSTVAISERTPELMLSFSEPTDAGILTLVPCGSSCPP